MTISGLFDFSAISNAKTTTQVGTAATTTSKTSTTGAPSVFATSQISFAGTEDLGGGLKAGFVLNTGTAENLVGNRDKFLTLAGGFGTVKIGRYAPAAAYGFYGLSGTATSAVGSIYQIGSTATRFGTIAAGSYERNDNNVQYTSPAFNGLTLNVNYGSTSTDASATLGEAQTQQTGVSVSYANGPVTVAAGVNNRSVDAEGAAAVNGITIDGSLNWIGASYNLGAAKLFATHVMREDDTTSAAGVNTVNTDIKLTSLGVSLPMGAYTFGASTYTGTNAIATGSTDDMKLSGYQLTAQYALSKRTKLFAIVGTNKIALDSGNTTGTARKETGSAFGLVYSF